MCWRKPFRKFVAIIRINIINEKVMDKMSVKMDKDTMTKIIKPNILIRADGNNKIGLGHIIRTVALGIEFNKNNNYVSYITRDNKGVLDILQRHNFDVFSIGSSVSIIEEIEIVKKIIQDNAIDIFIGDLYEIDNKYISMIRKYCKCIVIIDTLRDMSLKADLIINGCIYAYDFAIDAKRYNRRALLGTKYFIIREQFIYGKKRVINEDVKNILVTMGGADPLNLTSKIISILSTLDINLKINVVSGNAFRNIEEIEKTCLGKPKIQLHYNVDNMSDLMHQNDIAISTGGITLYELAITGTPAIVFTQAENQVLQSNIFNDKGNIINLGDGSELGELHFIETLNNLIRDYDKRCRMSKIGQEIIDGKGTERCYAEIIKVYKSLK